jgi:hypothetical protein
MSLGKGKCFLLSWSFWVFFALIFLPIGESSGLLQFEDAVFPELVTSGRALAMGNAYICKVDDSSSASYNPAGLGTIRWTHFHLTNLHIETNKNLISLGTGGNISTVPGKFIKGYDLDGSRELLLDNRGQMTHNRLSAMPNLTTRFFSLGYLFSQQARTYLDFATDALFEYSTRRDTGPYLALNFSLFGGIFKIGGTGVYLNRTELIAEQDANVKVDPQDSDYTKGKMLMVTAGARITLPFKFLPTIAVVQRNALDREFTETGGKSAPTKIANTMDVGISVTPQIGNTVRVHLEVNYKDIGALFPDVPTVRKVVMGGELDFDRTMFVRFGYGDGFGSGGVGIKSRRLEFDLTTYAIDTTRSDFLGREDRRISLTLSSGI